MAAGSEDSIKLVVTRRFNASPEQVFDAWLDAKSLGRWLFATPDGKMVRVEVDARVGGKFVVVERRGEKLAEHFGQYVELNRPHRLAFTFATDREVEPSLVVVDIRQIGDGCELTLTHTMDAQWAAYEERTRAGWTHILKGLEATMESDREIVVTRLFDAPRSMVYAAFTDAKHISKWWGPRGFRTTTRSKDVRVDGMWLFTMHGPDGTNYPNRVVYTEVVPNERLAYDHDDDGLGITKFKAETTFADEDGKTRVTLRLIIPTAAERDRFVQFGAVEGGHNTLERLSEELHARQPDAFVITRDFEAPRELVFKAWTEPERIAKWFGPKGFKITLKKADMRPGGVLHSSMEAPNMKMWAKWDIREVIPPERLVFINCFSDENGGLGRHPGAPNWPQQTLSVIEFEELGAERARLTIRWNPINAPAEEVAVFAANHESMRGGWGGTLDQLTTYLADETHAAKA